MTRRKALFGMRGAGGRRAHERVEAGMSVQRVSLASRHRSLLINISKIGARARAEDPLKKGAEVVLHVGGLEIFGRVVSKSGEQCGLRFDQDLTAFEVELCRRDAAVAVRDRLTPLQKGGVDEWNGRLAR